MIKKRNDEGFALAYVVVVIFVLCSIAIALMSHTLNTLKVQQNMIERMQDKYEAQGEIERLVAELDSIYLEKSDDSFEGTSLDQWASAGSNYLTGLINSIDYVSIKEIDSSNDTIWIITVESTAGTMSAHTEISLIPGITQYPDPYPGTAYPKTDEFGNFVYDEAGNQIFITPLIDRNLYSIDVKDVKFKTYEITTGGDAS